MKKRRNRRETKGIKKSAGKTEKSTRKNKLVYTSIALLLSLVLALQFDVIIVKFFASLRFPALNYFIFTINFLSSGIILFVLISAIFLVPSRIKKIIKVWLSLLLTLVVTAGFKVFFARARPFQIGVVSTFSQLIETSYYSWNSSFPSLHAAVVFSVLPFLLNDKKALRSSWIVFSALVLLSRIYLGVHYLSDVIAGAILGYLMGYLVLRIKLKKFKNG